jgi:aminopeptidase N
MPSLSRTEAEERAALLRVDGYHIDLDLTRGAEVFGSTVTVRFRAAVPGAATFLDVKPVALRAVTLNGRVLAPGDLVDGRLPLADLRPDNELVVEATMGYTNNGTGLHRFVDPADGAVYLYAAMFLSETGRVFGCFDQPDLKAPLSLRVTADPQWTVVANGAGRLIRPGRWEFAETKPLATYFVGLAAGPYHGVHLTGEIPMSLYARGSLAGQLDREAPELFEVTRACLDRFHELFGIRYPFGKYDQVFVPEFTVGAMENPGIVTFRDEFIFRDAVTEGDRELRAVVVAHEMAHMWFGDLVTMRWWDDLWLNESFAEYMGWRVAAEVTRFRGAWTGFTVGRKAWGYAADQRPSTHPVAGEVADADEATLNFDGISYAKGAAVLRQLVAWLGDEAFLAGVREHFARHAYGNATLADLLDALSQASGRDLAGWARLWLGSAGVNTLRLAEDAGFRYTVMQEGEPARPHRIGIGRYAGDGDRLGRVELDITGPATPVDLEPAELILLNDGDLSYAKVRLADWDRLPALLPKIKDPLTRALLWGAVWEAVRDAAVPAGLFVELVGAALPGESDVVIVERVLSTAQILVDRYLPAGRDAVYRACAEGLARTRDASRQLAFARGTVGFAESAGELRDWLVAGRDGFGLPVDDDLRWRVLYRLAALGAVSEGDIDAGYARDHSAAGAEQATRCRAARPDPAGKERAWQAIIGADGLSQRLLFATAEGFWQPGQEALTGGYVQRYAGEVPAMALRRNGQVVARLAALAYPHCAVTPDTLETMRGVLSRDDLTPALRRAVVDATDELTRSLAARALAHRPATAAGPARSTVGSRQEEGAS